jgi:histidinol-phosphate/aromatic aminotransferase/cobyric acid decarboxylase-like protein
MKSDEEMSARELATTSFEGGWIEPLFNDEQLANQLRVTIGADEEFIAEFLAVLRELRAK